VAAPNLHQIALRANRGQTGALTITIEAKDWRIETWKAPMFPQCVIDELARRIEEMVREMAGSPEPVEIFTAQR
jgi:hypothetical protein